MERRVSPTPVSDAPKPENGNAAPSAEEINQELDRILQSAFFPRSERLQRFLRFVGAYELRGEGHLLHEYLIGSEVFGRGEEYSPHEDGIVRRQAHAYAGNFRNITRRMALTMRSASSCQSGAMFHRFGGILNPWLDRILKDSPLQLAVTTSDRQRAIVNSQPGNGETGEWRIRYGDETVTATEEYALISMLPGADARHLLLLISGLNTRKRHKVLPSISLVQPA